MITDSPTLPPAFFIAFFQVRLVEEMRTISVMNVAAGYNSSSCRSALICILCYRSHKSRFPSFISRPKYG